MLSNYLKLAAAITLIDYNLITSCLRVVTTALRANRKLVLTLIRRKLLKESVPARKQVLELTLH
jgi:hypothetical protein